MVLRPSGAALECARHVLAAASQWRAKCNRSAKLYVGKRDGQDKGSTAGGGGGLVPASQADLVAVLGKTLEVTDDPLLKRSLTARIKVHKDVAKSVPASAPKDASTKANGNLVKAEECKAQAIYNFAAAEDAKRLATEAFGKTSGVIPVGLPTASEKNGTATSEAAAVGSGGSSENRIKTAAARLSAAKQGAAQAAGRRRPWRPRVQTESRDQLYPISQFRSQFRVEQSRSLPFRGVRPGPRGGQGAGRFPDVCAVEAAEQKLQQARRAAAPFRPDGCRDGQQRSGGNMDSTQAISSLRSEILARMEDKGVPAPAPPGSGPLGSALRHGEAAAAARLQERPGPWPPVQPTGPGGEFRGQELWQEEVLGPPLILESRDRSAPAALPWSSKRRRLCGNLRLPGPQDLAAALGRGGERRRLRVGTDCAGAEAPLLALREICTTLGQSHGIEVGVDHLFSCDVNYASREFIARNTQPAALFGDLLARDVISHCLLAEAPRMVPSDMDIYVAGFPCKDFSMLNHARPCLEGPNAAIYEGVVRYIQQHRPRAFILENVSGLLIKKKDQAEKPVDVVMRTLRAIPGYQVRGWKVNTVEYWLPQNRKRVYIVGVNTDRVVLRRPLEEWGPFLHAQKGAPRQPAHSFMLSDEEPEVLAEYERALDRHRRMRTRGFLHAAARRQAIAGRYGHKWVRTHQRRAGG
ncbi:unnamed protein product [Prorocentrum cordatum]|uniref:DNA (cytosine-5-)-methyltransferase n=1 Tax=Prorocentrum cordatum TaxID=2364126 RepID=A0ABN9SYJ3_9DINO|nr:unnamed protein product [Polarella glacialis]